MNFRDFIISLLNSTKKSNDFENQDFQDFQEFQNYEKKKPNMKPGKFKLLLLLPLLFVAASLIMSCQYTVEETEQAVVTTLGKVTSVETAGLHFKLPYPIQGVTKVAVNKTQKLQIGYASENEDKSYSSVSLADEAKMITGDFNIVNIDFFIEWKISDPVKFLYNSDEPSQILKMIAQSSARSIIGDRKSVV